MGRTPHCRAKGSGPLVPTGAKGSLEQRGQVRWFQLEPRGQVRWFQLEPRGQVRWFQLEPRGQVRRFLS